MEEYRMVSSQNILSKKRVIGKKQNYLFERFQWIFFNEKTQSETGVEITYFFQVVQCTIFIG